VASPSLHGEFTSTDASGLTEPNSRALLYGDGSTSAITLATTDQVVITSVLISVGASGIKVSVYDGADNTVDAGEKIAVASVGANGFVNYTLPVPHRCQVGTWPKVKTSASGQVDVTLHGYLTSVRGG
jgi:beta-lactamase superfamily II metal-dependent hydrolase